MKTLNNWSDKQVFMAVSFISIFFLFSSCSSNSAPPANEVFIQGMAFSPATLTVSVGTTVKWTNKDAIAHTVTSDTGTVLNSGNVAANGTFSFMFMTAGTYLYHCSIHPSMTAKIVVN
jgi:plastocyanin